MKSYNEDESVLGRVITNKSIVAAAVVLLLALLIWMFMIHAVKVDAGMEAVLIDKPIIFGHGGVRDEPVRTGRSYVWFTTDWYNVDMRPQQTPLHFDDLMSSDGVPLDFDSVIRFRSPIPYRSSRITEKIGTTTT